MRPSIVFPYILLVLGLKRRTVSDARPSKYYAPQWCFATIGKSSPLFARNNGILWGAGNGVKNKSGYCGMSLLQVYYAHEYEWIYANRNDRSRPHGRQYGSPIDQGKPALRRI